MGQYEKPNPLRNAIRKVLAFALMVGLSKDRTFPYWDHAVTGHLGDRSRWGFDVHKYHLKNHKYARRR